MSFLRQFGSVNIGIRREGRFCNAGVQKINSRTYRDTERRTGQGRTESSHSSLGAPNSGTCREHVLKFLLTSYTRTTTFGLPWVSGPSTENVFFARSPGPTQEETRRRKTPRAETLLFFWFSNTFFFRHVLLFRASFALFVSVAVGMGEIFGAFDVQSYRCVCGE